MRHSQQSQCNNCSHGGPLFFDQYFCFVANAGDEKSPTLPDIWLETFCESIERDPAARTIPQVLVHRDPGIQRQRELPLSMQTNVIND
jgi:hypothetical protein